MATMTPDVRGDTNLGVTDFKCPPGYSIYPAADCNKYYTCYGGQPVYLWQCRDNLLFDLTYNGCNYPEYTNCNNRFTTPNSGTIISKSPLPSTDNNNCLSQFCHHRPQQRLHPSTRHNSRRSRAGPARPAMVSIRSASPSAYPSTSSAWTTIPT